jgi:hypothetical protein
VSCAIYDNQIYAPWRPYGVQASYEYAMDGDDWLSRASELLHKDKVGVQRQMEAGMDNGIVTALNTSGQE